MGTDLVGWTPRTRAEHNAARRYSRWRVARLDRVGNALLVPLDENDQPITAGRIWVPIAQITAGNLAPKL